MKCPFCKKELVVVVMDEPKREEDPFTKEETYSSWVTLSCECYWGWSGPVTTLPRLKGDLSHDF